ncbi:MAG: transketolase family protein [Rhodoplanes sp.]|uniref:transketolase family protein n=1 Tax=Rhodoplanes sp. TaxID=1968906 RepID=UPI00178FA573|nr:transketolase C-terminal domain-containing protein [Rhodoplanes sp.]NVO16288.1 transketolase family protein [Rhodoplanes sp.]
MSTKSLRTAYGETLVELGRTDERIVVLEADLGKSTMSILFQQAFPDRFFEMGIAEQNMASTAAGLALTGKIPFMSTFAVFASGRAYDQLRQTISIARLNVKICGSSSGLSDFGDGSTHQAIEDVAIMRAIPNMTVLVPVDAVETRKMVAAMVEWPGPVYLRINRNDLPIYTADDASYRIGRLHPVRDGRDVVVFANGVMVSKAIAAADALAREGVSVKVVNVSTVKPLDRDAVLADAKGCKAVVTAEEHSIIGGLGSAIAEALRGNTGQPIEFVGIDDCFGTSAHGYDELLAHYRLTPEAIADAARSVLRLPAGSSSGVRQLPRAANS